jgi:hypothetical protein
VIDPKKKKDPSEDNCSYLLDEDKEASDFT